MLNIVSIGSRQCNATKVRTDSHRVNVCSVPIACTICLATLTRSPFRIGGISAESSLSRIQNSVVAEEYSTVNLMLGLTWPSCLLFEKFPFFFNDILSFVVA